MKNLKWSQKHKWTHSNKYVMPLLEEIFNAFGQAKVFNTLDLKSNYHQLPFKGGWQGQDEILGNQYQQEGLFVPMEVFAIFGLRYVPQGPSMIGVPHLNPKDSFHGFPNSPFYSFFPWHVLHLIESKFFKVY
jgi:hypothetical protein